MTEEEVRKRAEARFLDALARTGARDPREYYRERMIALRERDDAAFRRAHEHYDTHLIPAVARDDTDPIAEWLDYGRLLA